MTQSEKMQRLTRELVAVVGDDKALDIFLETGARHNFHLSPAWIDEYEQAIKQIQNDKKGQKNDARPNC